MGSYRIVLGLALSSICLVPACANLVGLNGYSVAGSGGASEAGASNDEAGSGNEAGKVAHGGSSHASAGSAGTTAESGAGSGGTAVGGGGASSGCKDDCDDGNDCTTDSCVSSKCQHDSVDPGTACGTGRTCDEDAVCVLCRDTALGKMRDEGCPATAPVCVGTGTKAGCEGCMNALDCADANDCTSETCLAGKCTTAPVAAGMMCANGVCNGTLNAEKCVACLDSAPGTAQDSGCSAAKPMCDTSGTPTCYECFTNTDCANDNVSCTNETCTNHVCSHVPDDSKCTPSADVCKPNKCDLTMNCKQVVVVPPLASTNQALITAAVDGGNGSFEAGTEPATGWEEDGPYFITKNCAAGCIGGSNNGVKTYPSPMTGKVLAWLGGVSDAGIGDLNHDLSLPVGTVVSLHIQADTNFQTKSAADTNHDYFQVRLMDAAYAMIGAPLVSKSNVDAQVGTTHPWTANGVDVTADVTAYGGKTIYVSFWSSTDTNNQQTDFFLDNVRVTATVCK